MTDVIKGKPNPERPAFYVLVVGMLGPKKRHKNYEKAVAEAARLHALHKGEKRVYILAPVATLDREDKVTARDDKPMLKLPRKTKAPPELSDGA